MKKIKFDKYDLLVILGYSSWIAVFGLNVLFEIDPLTRFLIVAGGSAIALTGIALGKKHRKKVGEKTD